MGLRQWLLRGLPIHLCWKLRKYVRRMCRKLLRHLRRWMSQRLHSLFRVRKWLQRLLGLWQRLFGRLQRFLSKQLQPGLWKSVLGLRRRMLIDLLQWLQHRVCRKLYTILFLPVYNNLHRELPGSDVRPAIHCQFNINTEGEM